MIIGSYCQSFKDATHAMPQGISLNAPYKFHWLKVEKVCGSDVYCMGGGEPMRFEIRKEGRGRSRIDFFLITMKDALSGPRQFKAYPFRSEER